MPRNFVPPVPLFVAADCVGAVHAHGRNAAACAAAPVLALGIGFTGEEGAAACFVDFACDALEAEPVAAAELAGVFAVGVPVAEAEAAFGGFEVESRRGSGVECYCGFDVWAGEPV